jgi:HAD superfamily hydrolase (TIGR01509 family)
MKKFTLLTLFAMGITLMKPIYTSQKNNTLSLTSAQSMMNYINSYLIQEQVSIPAAADACKKSIIFDLDGVLCKTNDLQAFYEIGMPLLLQYIALHGKPSTKKIFQALQNAPAVTTFDTYNDGLRLPQIMVDWQCNAQELRDIQDEMVKHILSSKLSIVEKNFLVSTISMMTTPDKFIRTRQPMPEGIELARTLKQLGYKLYILSNWDPTSFPLMVQQFPEIFELFDGVMTSGKTGMIKPNSDIFKACLQKFNIQKSQAIFIDDTIENIQTSEQLGITSIHCKNKNITDVKKQLIEILKR